LSKKKWFLEKTSKAIEAWWDRGLDMIMSVPDDSAVYRAVKCLSGNHGTIPNIIILKGNTLPVLLDFSNIINVLPGYVIVWGEGLCYQVIVVIIIIISISIIIIIIALILYLVWCFCHT
jgi:hypothetical protein